MMNRQGKENLRESLAERFKKANAVIVAEYRGLTVEEVTALRVELRKANADFKVIKNRIAKKAIQSDVPDLEPISGNLKGPVGVMCAYGDLAQATKAVLDFQKDHPKLVVTSGLIENNAVSADELKAIADLPSKEVLLGQIVGSLLSPHRNLVGVLSGVNRNLVQVINAIKDKKSS